MAQPDTLRVLQHAQRGAVRFPVLPGAAGARLHLVATSGPRPMLESFPVGFADAEVIEFYGVDAGARIGYLEVDAKVSPLLRFEVPIAGICVQPVPELAPRAHRTVRLTGPAADDTVGATLLLHYHGFDLLRRFAGKPITLEAPLHRPSHILLRWPSGASDEVRLGCAFLVPTMERDIELRVAADSGVLTVHPARPVAPASAYRMSLTAGADVVDKRGRLETSRLVAVLRDDEFAVPPRVHTWLRGPIDGALRVTGVPNTALRIGVGLQRRARYLLWRTGRRDSTLQAAEAASAVAKRTGELPPWIRPNESELPEGYLPVAPGGGPAELWSEQRGAAGTIRYREALRAGAATLQVPRHVVGLQLPQIAADETFELVVRAAQPVRDSGILCSLTSKGAPRPLPPLPDGLLDATVWRAGAVRLQLRGVIRNGRLETAAEPWGPRPQHANAAVSLRLCDERGQPLAGLRLVPESSGALVSTDAEGRVV
ncbi:MAG: hypothetical protein KDC87_22255, partial [Planctomycetes bacterium]|nr:hypothetical protein [Planctomycetota bacterium]